MIFKLYFYSIYPFISSLGLNFNKLNNIIELFVRFVIPPKISNDLKVGFFLFITIINLEAITVFAK
jgi:hypothetical protein